MKVVSTLAWALSLATFTQAHMELKYPPPFRSSYNPNNGGDIDYDIRSPLDAGGSDFPCKGDLGLIGTAKGKSVATWTPGQSYSFTITGNTPHNGGSCQASLSFDRGKTWKVIHSYIGNCPVNGDSAWPFTLPSDTPSGDMVFAWSWFNWEGNREMYMNCAVITVKSAKKRAASIPISSRPNMFVANVGNGACTYEGVAVEFPQPGPDVSRGSQKSKPPGTVNCGWGGN